MSGALRTAALAAGSGVAFAVATRPGWQGFVAFFAAFLLHLAVTGARSRSGAAMATSLAAAGPASVAVTPVAPLHPLGAVALMLAVAASFAVVGTVASARTSGRRPTAATAIERVILTTVGWCALEGAWGSHAIGGAYALPVMTIGSALADGPIRVVAAHAGQTGLSGTVLVVGALAALARLPMAIPPRRETRSHRADSVSLPRFGGRLLRGLLAFALLGSASWFALPVGAGDARPGESVAMRNASAPHLPVRLVQHVPTPAGIAASRFSDSEHARRWRPLAAALSSAEDRLVVWPEAAWPRPIDLSTDRGAPTTGTDPVGALLDVVPRGTSLLLGAATVAHDGVRNSVLLVDRGAVTRVADKARPVPLTESHLVAGRPGRTATWRGLAVAAAVCWDAVFPDVAQAAVAGGADVLVVVANDAYAGRGPVAALHLRQARLRAVEIGRPVLFVQATGPSAAIDATGRLIAVLPAGVPGHLDVDVPLATDAHEARAKGGGA